MIGSGGNVEWAEEEDRGRIDSHTVVWRERSQRRRRNNARSDVSLHPSGNRSEEGEREASFPPPLFVSQSLAVNSREFAPPLIGIRPSFGHLGVHFVARKYFKSNYLLNLSSLIMTQDW